MEKEDTNMYILGKLVESRKSLDLQQVREMVNEGQNASSKNVKISQFNLIR